MPIVNRIHLFALANREFRREAEAPRRTPGKRTFKGMNLNLRKLDTDFRKRGSAVRWTGVLLREDPDALHRRVCADEKAVKTYDGAAEWLEREARHLRKFASMQETAASRLNTILARCREERQVPPS